MSRETPSLRKNCPYSEFFCSAFSRIQTEYGDLRSKSPYSVRMRENLDQKYSEYGHFLRSTYFASVFAVDFERYPTYLVIVLSGGKIIPTKFIFEWFNAAMS